MRSPRYTQIRHSWLWFLWLEQGAAQLYLAVGTVKRHVFNLYGKLGATSRPPTAWVPGAVARARELGLL